MGKMVALSRGLKVYQCDMIDRRRPIDLCTQETIKSTSLSALSGLRIKYFVSISNTNTCPHNFKCYGNN